jgi:hypothetical protein
MDSRAVKIAEVAGNLGIPPAWLDGVIAFESGYNPTAQNPIAYNQALVDKGEDTPRYARGLIQFIDSTAQGLGFLDSLDLVTRLPDFDAQMDRAVLPYFQKYAPFTSEQDVYMTVFYPAYRHVAPSTEFSAAVQRVNPGIKTVQDYINKVNMQIASRRLIPVGKTVLMAAVAVGLLYLTLKG